jgi:HPt (histidine-containing phosphotransfer) domain-containing protein
MDFSFLDEMLRLSKGNPKYVASGIQRFLINGKRDLDELHFFKQDKNRRALLNKAHRFISTCSVVGAMRLIEMCKQLLKDSQDRSDAQISDWLEEMDKEFALVSELLTEYLAKISADSTVET